MNHGRDYSGNKNPHKYEQTARYNRLLLMPYRHATTLASTRIGYYVWLEQLLGGYAASQAHE